MFSDQTAFIGPDDHASILTELDNKGTDRPADLFTEDQSHVLDRGSAGAGSSQFHDALVEGPLVNGARPYDVPLFVGSFLPCAEKFASVSGR